MRKEVLNAVAWWCEFLFPVCVDEEKNHKRETFGQTLFVLLWARYRDHWYVNEPLKGNGFRAIHIDGPSRVDPVLRYAARGVCEDVLAALPHDTQTIMWIDPGSVTVRQGSGPINVVFEGEPIDDLNMTPPDRDLQSLPRFSHVDHLSTNGVRA